MNLPSKPLAMPVAVPVDRRCQLDRREKPTSAWAAFWPGGQRIKGRRAEDRRQAYFVDRFTSAMFVGIVLLIAASLVDAVLTLYIIREGGGEEANPLMSLLLDRGMVAFVVGKYLMTVLGLPLLLIFKNHRLFIERLRVGHLIPVAVALYIVLIAYQIVGINRHMGW